MNIHEYQAKALLREAGALVSDGPCDHRRKGRESGGGGTRRAGLGGQVPDSCRRAR